MELALRPPSGLIDVADPRFDAPAYWLSVHHDFEIGVMLTDPQAPAKGEEIKHWLRVSGFADAVSLSVYMGESHNVGILWGPELLAFLRNCAAISAAPAGKPAARGALYDFSQYLDLYPSTSGVEIVFDGDLLRVVLGQHCFVAGNGPLVRKFFHRALARATFQLEGKNAA